MQFFFKFSKDTKQIKETWRKYKKFFKILAIFPTKGQNQFAVWSKFFLFVKNIDLLLKIIYKNETFKNKIED